MNHESRVDEPVDIYRLFSDMEPSLDMAAVVQHTVARGELPALVVVRDDEDYWLVGDGIGDPNSPGACGLYHMAHVTERDPSVSVTVALPKGYAATRDSVGDRWQVEKWHYGD
jgi:hypothetical protein